MNKKTILLHVCCAGCAPHAAQVLLQDYHVFLLFSNSNIAPQDEYERRLSEVRRLASIYRIPLLVDWYAHEDWLMCMAGLEEEPEGGERCRRCFVFNLARTARIAEMRGMDCFTTTLTASPHKNTTTVFTVGAEFPFFLPMDFKKNNGFRRTVDLSNKYKLYRQNYCGCEFSHRERVPVAVS